MIPSDGRTPQLQVLLKDTHLSLMGLCAMLFLFLLWFSSPMKNAITQGAGLQQYCWVHHTCSQSPEEHMHHDNFPLSTQYPVHRWPSTILTQLRMSRVVVEFPVFEFTKLACPVEVTRVRYDKIHELSILSFIHSPIQYFLNGYNASTPRAYVINYYAAL